MNIKKIFQIFSIFVVVLVMGGTIYFSKITQQQQKKISPAKAEKGSARPEYKPAENKIDPNQWAQFTHPEYNYQLRYPQEFSVERRGKIGDIDDLVAFNYIDGNKRLTIVKVQITNATSEEKTSSSQKGADNNGNEVIVFKKPFNDSKTITIIGTIYPNTGSNFRFEEVIQKIIESLK